MLDAQSIKSSEGGEARGFDAGKKTTGRKRHIVVDTLGLILVVMVTSRLRAGPARRPAILARGWPRAFPAVALVWADGGYANASIAAWWAGRGEALPRDRDRQAQRRRQGFQVLPRRWVVERTFGWLVRNRRLARDYERLTANSEAMIKIAMIRLMAARLAGQSCTWASAIEREALHRITVEDQLTT